MTISLLLFPCGYNVDYDIFAIFAIDYIIMISSQLAIWYNELWSYLYFYFYLLIQHYCGYRNEFSGYCPTTIWSIHQLVSHYIWYQKSRWRGLCIRWIVCYDNDDYFSVEYNQCIGRECPLNTEFHER